VFGESYAGMYAPSCAREIHLQNGRPENANATINLKVREEVLAGAAAHFKALRTLTDRFFLPSLSRITPTENDGQGLALGNGWVAPLIQTKSYPEYAYHHSLIDEQGKAWLEKEIEDCVKAIYIKRGGEQVCGLGSAVCFVSSNLIF
jgi:carboxypeptidase C (cathepsin A)